MRPSGIIGAVATTPVDRLSTQECTHGTEIAFVAQEVGLFLALGPEPNGVGEGVHGLAVASNERAAKVDVFDLMFFRLEVGDLADVVTWCC